jgi:hypothetical protein
MLTDEERKRRNAERSAKWREANPERARAGVQKWVQENPERKAESDRAYRQANQEKIAAQQKARREADPEAYSAYHREYAATNAEVRREQNWMRKYNTTRQIYNDTLAAQGGGCAACGKKEPGGRGKYFHVDHDHQTGKIRGLLCHECNTALRAMDKMRALMAYAENPPGVIR